MKKNIVKLFLAVFVLSFSSCETLDLDQTENPSTLEKDKLDPVYAFNYIQLTLPDFVNSANSFTQRVTRQMAMTGGNTYNNAFAGVNFNDNWTTGYQILNAVKTMEPRAQQNNQTFILGASKVIRSYVLMTLVDMYGDIPYSEALMGTANLKPKYDKSADVYANIYNELNEAIELLKATGAAGDGLKGRDLYYGGELGTETPSRWITVAKTLKLKMLNNARLVGTIGTYSVLSEASALLSENDLIDSKEEDFEFKYGRNRVNPNSRHPMYNDQYETGGGAYIGNYFIWALTEEKVTVSNSGVPSNVNDPREYYYLHKQTIVSNSTSDQTLPCNDIARPTQFNLDKYNSFYSGLVPAAYCHVEEYLGRDHGDNSGIPNDSDVRAVAGLYPIGGVFLAGASKVQNSGTDGALGEGIMPMLLTSYVHFIKAELQYTIFNNPTTAKVELTKGMETSFDKVLNFRPDYVRDPSTLLLSQTFNPTNKYINFVLDTYDAPGVNQLEVILKEYYLAAWGNGIEPYNNYRRTGYPSNFQPTFQDDPGAFFSTALYSDYSVNNNPNTPPSVRTRRVFWDVAGLDLH